MEVRTRQEAVEAQTLAPGRLLDPEGGPGGGAVHDHEPQRSERKLDHDAGV
jgi:hypothetical protein